MKFHYHPFRQVLRESARLATMACTLAMVAKRLENSAAKEKLTIVNFFLRVPCGEDRANLILFCDSLKVDKTAGTFTLLGIYSNNNYDRVIKPVKTLRLPRDYRQVPEVNKIVNVSDLCASGLYYFLNWKNRFSYDLSIVENLL